MNNMKRPAPSKTASYLKCIFKASGKRHLLITGSRKSGKTTLLNELLGSEKLLGLKSKAEFKGEFYPEKIELLDIATGCKAIVGKYENNAMKVQKQGFEIFGVKSLKALEQTQNEWVQIDELGFLERDCTAFCNEVKALFEKKRVIAVLRKQKGIPLNDFLLAKNDVFVFDLDTLMPEDNLQIGCAILAAGQSKRFGENKLITQFKGMPMLEQTFLRLPPRLWGNTVVVTNNKEIENLANKYGVSTTTPKGKHLSDSIRCGIESLKHLDGVIFSVGDQPLCTEESVGQILNDFVLNKDAIVRLSFETKQGNPVIFPKSLFADLSKLKGEQGGSTVIKNNFDKLRLVKAKFAFELEDADTKEKLNELIKIL